MISTLIWSKDRACQLDALLTSLRKYVPSKEVVLYKTSNEEFEMGYDICRRIHPSVTFMKEHEFYNDTLFCIENSPTSHICLSTDDTVVFDYAKKQQYITEMVDEHSVFSFRLGYNTVVQDHLAGMLQKALVPDKVDKDFLIWNPSPYKFMNYGYPHALDMHVYKTNYILPILKEIRFKNTNELEGILQKYNSRITQLISYKESIAVNVPLNNISGLTGVNRHSNMSMEEMNKLYLQGKRLWYTFDNPIVGCHQDIPFVME